MIGPIFTKEVWKKNDNKLLKLGKQIEEQNTPIPYSTRCILHPLYLFFFHRTYHLPTCSIIYLFIMLIDFFTVSPCQNVSSIRAGTSFSSVIYFRQLEHVCHLLMRPLLSNNPAMNVLKFYIKIFTLYII